MVVAARGLLPAGLPVAAPGSAPKQARDACSGGGSGSRGEGRFCSCCACLCAHVCAHACVLARVCAPAQDEAQARGCGVGTGVAVGRASFQSPRRQRPAATQWKRPTPQCSGQAACVCHARTSTGAHAHTRAHAPVCPFAPGPSASRERSRRCRNLAPACSGCVMDGVTPATPPSCVLAWACAGGRAGGMRRAGGGTSLADPTAQPPAALY